MWDNQEGQTYALQKLNLNEPAGDYVLYISIPFCRVQCKSCPYFINGLTKEDKQNYEGRYLEALLKDIEKWSSYPRWKNGKLRAIYIGGGTGTILKTKNLEKLINKIMQCFPVAEDYSLTLEGNARDYDEEKLDYVANSPINRVSLGVQSFNPDVLKIVGSPHAAESSIYVINELGKRNFHNVQLDLMYNLPGHTLEIWEQDLQKLKSLNIKHFTIYLYRIHEGTVQEMHLRKGKVPNMHDRESTTVKEMHADAVKIAEDMGFNMYMFDHFAEPGFEAPYNHWTFKEAKDALGIGAGAYSFINGYRTGTKKDVDGYIETVNRGEHMINSISKKMCDRIRKERYVIFAFQYFNIDFSIYYKQFGSNFMDDFGDIAYRLEKKGLITIHADQIKMTNLGREWHMNIFLEFFNEEIWNEFDALKQENWAMNIPMVQLATKGKEYWLGN
ncbi:MAG: Fe-S oxidoreductase, coproporphyrinogen oxidase [Gammaproteobacteria bacterium]|jgi:oxygen-independent coproporphyrinogen-3 oxidase|nr:Fe-S oxidoreductase, coproporphyrinogen oxidase [Gammaproteobacteria bacterium]